MVSRRFSGPGLTLAAAAAAEVVVVAAIAHAYGTDGVLSTLAALVLAPVAVVLVWLLAARIDGPRFADAAAIVYVLLPALGALFMLGTYRSTFTHRALPDLVGLRATPMFALGLVLAIVALARGSAVLFAAAGVAALVKGAGDLGAIRVGLHETAWSVAFAEWVAVAGVLGAARRAPLRAVVLGGWLVLGVAHAARQGYENAAFWQSLSLATPAIAVLLSSLWLLLPRLRPSRAPLRAH